MRKLLSFLLSAMVGVMVLAPAAQAFVMHPVMGSPIMMDPPSTMSDYVNRAELVKMVLVDAGYTIWDGSTPTSCVFTDMTGAEWYYPYAVTACEKGFISDGEFRASDLVNKAEAVKAIYVAYSVPYSVPATPTYTDVAPGTWYYEYIESLVSYGVLLSGISNFYPSDALKMWQAKFWLSRI
ncbi:MAG: S-layer homology domain-containing protein [Candidatus Gracilibacteria bacterium]